MKITKLSTMGGSGKQTAPRAPDTGDDFDQKLSAYKRRMEAHTAEIKHKLAAWIAQTMSPADDTSVTIALLELGFERRLDLLGEEDARDLTERTFRRVVQRRKGTLQ